ncbi:SRPBCC family protein [Alkalicoccobacillus gibsonii]|uniref:SRPBCC family protein n=1 Tax=Alkalicoccobacillus gibsonii TaxID=79881 RepID=UPI0035133BCD
MNQNQLENIQKKVEIDAPIYTVWSLVSTPTGLAQWFMPGEIKASEGHEFNLKSPFGPSPCKVTLAEEPNQLTFDWDKEGWFVDMSLKEMGDKTECTVTHGGWGEADTIIGKANEKSSVIRERMDGGWTGIISKLKAVAEE